MRGGEKIRLAARARNDVFGAEGRSCRAQGAMALEEAAKLLLAEPPEKRPEPLPSMEVDRLEHVVRGGGRLDQDDAPVGVVVATDDESSLLHPVDDPGRARHRRAQPPAVFGDVGPLVRSSTRTFRWTRLIASLCMCLNSPKNWTGFQDVSSSTTARASASRAALRRCGVDDSVNVSLIFNGT